jgi:hypothetical protein
MLSHHALKVIKKHLAAHPAPPYINLAGSTPELDDVESIYA